MKTKLKASFEKIQKVRMQSTFGVTEWERVNITYNINFNMLNQYGSFEMYDDSGEYYSEGGLWFKEGKLYDYDGVYSLPKEIVKQLNKWGLDTSYLD